MCVCVRAHTHMSCVCTRVHKASRVHSTITWASSGEGEADLEDGAGSRAGGTQPGSVPWLAQLHTGWRKAHRPRGDFRGRRLAACWIPLHTLRAVAGQLFSSPLGTYRYPPEGLELQVSEVLRQFFWLQMVKEQGDFPLLAGVRFYPLSQFPGPVTGIAFVSKSEKGEDGVGGGRIESMNVSHKNMKSTTS